MHISTGIAQIIHKLYPILLFTFGDYNKNKFETNNDRTIVRGGEYGGNCNGYLIYANLGQFNNIGLNAGIHTTNIIR